LVFGIGSHPTPRAAELPDPTPQSGRFSFARNFRGHLGEARSVRILGAISQDWGSMELVTGATGYVGARLLRRLSSEGRPARALARRPERVEPLDGVEALPGDMLSGAGLARALDGCSTA
jgi:hypothetical protein